MRDFFQGENFVKAFRLSSICLLLLTPNLAWKYFISYSEYVEKTLFHDEVFPRFLTDLFLIWVAVQISATAGYAWSRRPRLIGMAGWSDVLSNLKLILILGIVISTVEAVFFDFWLLRPLFRMYPRNPFTSFAYVAEEVLFRFGILAIAFRLTRSISASVLIAAVFNIGAGLRAVYFGDASPPIGLVSVAVIKSFALSILFGYLYVKKGLLPTMTVRFIIGLKFAVYAFISF